MGQICPMDTLCPVHIIVGLSQQYQQQCKISCSSLWSCEVAFLKRRHWESPIMHATLSVLLRLPRCRKGEMDRGLRRQGTVWGKRQTKEGWEKEAASDVLESCRCFHQLSFRPPPSTVLPLLRHYFAAHQSATELQSDASPEVVLQKGRPTWQLESPISWKCNPHLHIFSTVICS